MELSGVDFYDTSDWFVNNLQRDAVLDIVFVMADDRYQEECRYLMRFWWYLGQCDYAPNIEVFESHLSPKKLTEVEELFAAIAHSPEAVKDWIQKYRTIYCELEDTI